jgi:hypothetical protein
MNRIRFAVLAGALFVSNAALAEGTLEEELDMKLDTYARAVQAGDTSTVQGLLSREMLARIANRGRSARFQDNLEQFVLREQVKVNRELGDLSANPEGFTLTMVQPHMNGRVLAVFASMSGHVLPKPFFFVQEDGEYKLNIIRPKDSYSIQRTSTYSIKNDDFTARSFVCAGKTTSYNVAATQSLDVTCEDSCSWYFDGTRVTVNGASADCDWNNWGYDAYIRSNSPFCNDPC